MIKVLVVDRDLADRDYIVDTLNKVSSLLYVVGSFDIVSACYDWLKKNLEPDLVIIEWQAALEDKSRLQIHQQIACPIIYTGPSSLTSHECYSNLGLDYIEKPLLYERIVTAIRKYLLFRNHFFREFEILFKGQQTGTGTKRDYMLVKKGQENMLLRIDEISFFYNESRLTFVYDLHGNKYYTDIPLIKLQKTLDNRMFFRATKKHLVSIKGIKKFKSHEKGKIELTLIPESIEIVYISQYTAAEFKNWITG